jgi:hypothetical protein
MMSRLSRVRLPPKLRGRISPLKHFLQATPTYSVRRGSENYEHWQGNHPVGTLVS